MADNVCDDGQVWKLNVAMPAELQGRGADKTRPVFVLVNGLDRDIGQPVQFMNGVPGAPAGNEHASSDRLKAAGLVGIYGKPDEGLGMTLLGLPSYRPPGFVKPTSLLQSMLSGYPATRTDTGSAFTSAT